MIISRPYFRLSFPSVKCPVSCRCVALQRPPKPQHSWGPAGNPPVPSCGLLEQITLHFDFQLWPFTIFVICMSFSENFLRRVSQISWTKSESVLLAYRFLFATRIWIMSISISGSADDVDKLMSCIINYDQLCKAEGVEDTTNLVNSSW
jgi:hypothetical protein